MTSMKPYLFAYRRCYIEIEYYETRDRLPRWGFYVLNERHQMMASGGDNASVPDALAKAKKVIDGPLNEIVTARETL